MNITKAIEFLKSEGLYFEEMKMSEFQGKYYMEGSTFTEEQLISIGTYISKRNLRLVNEAMAWMDER